MAITRIFNNQITDLTITNVKIANSTLTGDKMNPNLTFNSNLTLNGNLTVTGNVTAVQSTTTQITDPLLTLALGNSGTSYDMGLILIRGSGGNRFIGYKENVGAFVFINTTEDGLTSGNIATTNYVNVIVGNLQTIGSTTLGGFTISGNTLSSAGAMTIRSDAGSVTIPNATTITGATIISSTLSVGSTATVNALTSNGAIIATTGSFSSNLTGSALTVNNSATIGSTLGVAGNINGTGLTLSGSQVTTGSAQALGGIQATPIGNAATSTAQFTTVGASGNVTASALTVNNTATIGSTLGVAGNLNGTSATLTGSATIGTTLGVTGNATIGNVSTAAIGASGLVTITNTTDATGASTGALQVAGGASVNKNLYVTGNIYAGNIIAIQANTLSVQDPLLYLTANTPYPYNYSIGFYSQYQGGTPANVNANIYQHTGFVKDNSDLTWKLFSNVVAEPGITVDFTNAQWEQVKHGNLIVAGTSSVSGAASFAGNATINGLTVNTSAVITNSLQSLGGLQATPIGNAATSTAQFTTVGASGNATVAALTVNGTATIGSTLGVTGNINGSSLTLTGSQVTTGSAQALGGLQATPIGNASASSGAFTTLTASGLTTVTNTTDSTGPTSGAVVISGGLGVAKTLNVTTAANLGNVTFNNLTISSNTANQGININPNGTGTTTINSGLNASKTVINGTGANTLVVTGTQVGVNIGTPTTGAILHVGGTESMIIPVGTLGQRPGTAATGMLRFSSTDNIIEWYNGTSWSQPSTNFTVVVANTQTGNGSATLFTLPVSNASTAGTIVSINGVVQQPTSAYSITGANVTFTEAPSSTDVIDFRVFTTTSQITAITDVAGTTGLFFDLPSVGSKIATFKTNGTESVSIQSNSDVILAGNLLTSSNAVANIGSLANQFNTIFAKATSAQYADLAENYASDDVYPPGTVLEFGGVAEVTLASNATARVAGVVSTNPAYLMNSAYEGAGKVVSIALQGRVPCKVKGQVRKGDMMVSAGNGYAQAAANPKIGTVIGKSLENFDGAEGVIEVVVGRL